MIIGNKETFAVEITKEVNRYGMGYGKLWFQNQFLGTKEDLIYLNGYLVSLIDELINSKSIQIESHEKDILKIFNLIKSTGNARSEFAVIGSTFTDDFEIYSFEKLNDIFVLWKLRETVTVFDELKTYSKKIHIGKVSKQNLLEMKFKVVEEIN